MAGTRLQIVGAFALFALLAAPVAWHLTRVQRVDLPLSRIQQLSWQTSRFGGPDRFQVHVYSLSSSPTISSLASSSSKIEYITRNLQLDAQNIETLQAAARSGLQATDDALETLVPTLDKRFRVFLLCDDDMAMGSLPFLTVGKYRHAWTLQCQVETGDALHRAIEKLVQSHVYAQLDDKKSGREDGTTMTARRALQYRLRFSLLKENPTTLWNEELRTLVDLYMGRFVQKVGAVASFAVETEVIHYARLAKEIKPSSDEKEGFYIDADDLKHFKSANDYLDASVLDDREQVLHFMAALPDPVHAPLCIRPSDLEQSERGLATSFALPRWGIAVILNPFAFMIDSNDGDVSSDDAAASSLAIKNRELQRVMGLFVSEFRILLGIPSFLYRQREEDAASGGISRRQLLFLPSPVDGVADWELDVVMRERFATLMKSAIETLQSTVELVEALPELSVLERVQTRAEMAVTRLEAILCDSNQEQSQDCVEASDLHRLLAMARQASEMTDAAYYDHTMIRQLYFPQEQMLGVYAPLVAPLVLPFLLGLVRELKRYKAKRAATKLKVQ
uniref:GPI transamidase component PIG-S n=1 Tax=Peronospora matthiolae TaxID=2874970 RepID=A0AAV1TMT6_9STRA